MGGGVEEEKEKDIGQLGGGMVMGKARRI